MTAQPSEMTLETPYELNISSRDEFARSGFVRLSNVLSRELVTTYEPVITSQVIELNTMHRPIEERSTYNKAFLQVQNLWRHSAQVRDLVFSSRLAGIAAGLLDVKGVRLYHDQALYKEAGGGITPWHADQYYWPLGTDRCCTIWLPLQDTPREMGPLSFARGSHRFEFGRGMSISDESEAALQEALSEANLPVVEEGFALGDASFHLGWTFHRASPNMTDRPRRAITIIYIDADITVVEPKNANQEADLAAWMPGARPGETVDTPLNPVLYRRA